jgi:hypothetical protein
VPQSDRLARHGGQTIRASGLPDQAPAFAGAGPRGQALDTEGVGPGCGKAVSCKPPWLVERPIQASGMAQETAEQGRSLCPLSKGRRSTGTARTPCSSYPISSRARPARR